VVNQCDLLLSNSIIIEFSCSIPSLQYSGFHQKKYNIPSGPSQDRVPCKLAESSNFLAPDFTFYDYREVNMENWGVWRDKMLNLDLSEKSHQQIFCG
jgi:hypothetical protein